LVAAKHSADRIEIRVRNLTVLVERVQLAVGAQPAPQSLRGIDVLEVLQARPRRTDGLTVMKDTELEQRLGRHAPAVESAADVVSGGEDEGVGAQSAVARAHRGDAAARRLERLHSRFDHAQADRLLKPPAMRRWWRRQQLERIGGEGGGGGR